MATLFDPRSIANGTLPAAKLVANSITSAQIAAGAVNQSAILLDNNAYLQAKNSSNVATGIVKLNASNVIEFASLPQAPGTPSGPNDLTNVAYIDARMQGLKPKETVRLATTADVDLATGTLLVIDGVQTVAGDRILVWQQTAPEENGIYIAATGAWTRAADADLAGELTGAYTVVSLGTLYGQKGYVETAVISTLDTDPVTWVQFNAATAMIGGDMITVTGATISVDLHSTSGLESSNPGNAAGQLRVKLEASNPTLQIDGSNQLGAKLDAAGAIVTGASGLKAQLEASNPSLQISSNELGIKFDAAGGLSKVAAGTKVNTDAATTKINGSNQVEGLKTIEETFTLTSTGLVTFKDLSHAAYGTSPSVNSVSLCLAGFPIQQKTVDYSVSLTGGAAGVTRINWASLGLDGFVIDGDKIIVTYSYL